MRLISAFYSRVSVRDATRALRTRQGCVSHSEAATLSARGKGRTR